MSRKPLVAILDGNAIVHRAFHALPPLTSSDGTLVNAAYGFTTTLLKVIKDIKPSHVIATFDHSEKTFRHEQYADYKAHRAEAPDGLYEQIPIIKDILDTLGVVHLDAPGFEADDIIGTLAKQLPEKGLDVAIITGDMDTLQLVNDHVSVHTFAKGFSEQIIYTPATVRERFGFGPEGMIQYKALRGDPSDNIPGVPGVGEKTGSMLIQKFGTIDKMYKALEKKELPEGVSAKLREKLLANRASADQSLDLVTIRTDLPLKFDLDSAAVTKPDTEAVFAMFQKLGFKSLLSKIETVFGGKENAETPKRGDTEKNTVIPSDDAKGGGVEGTRSSYHLVDSEEKLADLVKKLSSVTRLCVDTETTDLDPLKAELLGISLCWQAGEAYYISTADKKFRELVLQNLGPVLADEEVTKVGHNLKFDIRVLTAHGFKIAGPLQDSLIIAYLVSRIGSVRRGNRDNLIDDDKTFFSSSFVHLDRRTVKLVTLDSW
jgi:DNA polymerase-1